LADAVEKNVVVVTRGWDIANASGPLLKFVAPSGKHTKKLWKITIFNEKTHYKLPFSIAMFVYQTVLFELAAR
jgi:hypothetical protein